MSSEVLIIGGGVIGLSIARELHRKGQRVTIVDRGVLGGEASWAAAGMLAPNIETDSSEAFHRFGREALEAYPDFAEQVLEETGIDIELDRSGTLCLAFNEAESRELEETYQRQISRGVAVERLAADQIRKIEPAISEGVFSGLFYSEDWQVENRRLVAALRRFAELKGISIVENTNVENLVVDGRRIVGASTSSRDLAADFTVVATGAWTSLIKIGDSPMPVNVKPVRGQMISYQLDSRKLQRVVYSHRGYLVPRADGRLLVGATVEDAGFEKATTDEGIESLAHAASEIIPELESLAIDEKWSGLRPFAGDGLPLLGEVPGYENLLIATAHYRNGILLAPLTGKIVADKLVDGVEAEHFSHFGPGRFSSAANVTAK